MGRDLIDSSSFMIALGSGEVKPEEAEKAMRVVCGARACHGPTEAYRVLAMLGLMPDKAYIRE